MAYIPYADVPDYYAEIQRRRGMVGNILKVHGIEPEVGRATPPASSGRPIRYALGSSGILVTKESGL